MIKPNHIRRYSECRFKHRTRSRRFESGFMQDKGNLLDESPVNAVLRKLKDHKMSWAFDTVMTKDGGRTVYAHMDHGGEELFFEANGDYVTCRVQIPVIGRVCNTEKDISDLVEDAVDFVMNNTP